MKEEGVFLSRPYLRQYRAWRKAEGLDDFLSECRWGMIGPGPDLAALERTEGLLRRIDALRKAGMLPYGLERKETP